MFQCYINEKTVWNIQAATNNQFDMRDIEITASFFMIQEPTLQRHFVMQLLEIAIRLPLYRL